MANLSPRRVRACLFDMDGLLIDSEDVYTEATNTILHEHGKPSLPWSVKARLQGRPGPEVNPPSIVAIPTTTKTEQILAGRTYIPRMGKTALIS